RAVAGGVPLEQALLSATAVPARLLGLEDTAGALRSGRSADVLVVDQDLELLQVLRHGRPL
ncbi:amidohydrolase family protein, partial [Glutamicibacter creatinolyticus]|uniref:amidohydrolase family protein n=1 Tax=Glutamicibacter creatinolyticus TaxID=162496 RepID=UPI003B97E555